MPKRSDGSSTPPRTARRPQPVPAPAPATSAAPRPVAARRPKAAAPAPARSLPPARPASAPLPAAGPTTPRSRKGVLTRARLLESAKRVFEETGFLEARISDIADGAGLSHGSFYHYFESKEQIFREVAEQQEALLTVREDSPPGDALATTELDRIRRANRQYFERYRANGRIMGVIEEVSRYDAPVNDARMRRQRHFAERAERAIRRLQAEGSADTEIDPRIAAVALGSMVGRFAELWLVEQWAPFDFDEVVDQVSRLWANAIGLQEPAKRRRPASAAKRARPQ